MNAILYKDFQRIRGLRIADPIGFNTLSLHLILSDSRLETKWRSENSSSSIRNHEIRNLFDTSRRHMVLSYSPIRTFISAIRGRCMAKNRVLVVDDEPDVLMLTCTALEDAGFDVIKAKDVPQGQKAPSFRNS